MNKPNIILYFSDQQRWDTVNETVMPNLCALAKEGVTFKNNFTCQPVCGPARACLQSGRYASQTGCFYNGIPLPEDTKTLAHYFNDAAYQTAYIGKWHLASDRIKGMGIHCETKPIPKSRQGGYQYMRASDVLEFTSHGYDGYVFDENGKRYDFKGYRADCINDYALEYLDKCDKEKPFFMFVSQLEPHHQNDHHRIEGYRQSVDDFKDYPIADDLTFLKGSYRKDYPDYISAINRLDYNLGRLIDKLKSLGIYDDTIIIYTSDHGAHFKTRNAEYKRSCHDASIHTPLVIKGGKFTGGLIEERLSSLIDLPPTLLSMAGIPIPGDYMGIDLARLTDNSVKPRDCVYIEISEASNSRAIRTQRFKYEVRDPAITGYVHHHSKAYFESYLYDLKRDPNEMHNLVKDPAYKHIRQELKYLLLKQMENTGEERPVIFPAVRARKK